MAKLLLEKILSNEFSINDTLGWLSNNIENENFVQLKLCCTREEFITFFLNFIHENLFCNCRQETPQKVKKIEPKKQDVIKRRSLFKKSQNNDESHLKKTTDANISQASTDSQCVASTPKNSKSTSSDHSFNNYSPIQNTLRLGDFIVETKKKSTKKKLSVTSVEEKKSKRINPTNLNDSKFRSMFVKSENSFNFQSSGTEYVENLSKDRSFFTNEIKNISISKTSISNLELRKLNVNVSPSIGIVPNPKLVRFKDEIDKFALIYRYLLENNLVLNLVGELYFLASLLVVKCHCVVEDVNILDNTDLNINFEHVITPKDIFKTIHNVIYFVCTVFKSLIYIKSLDKLTLKYLSQNDRLIVFLPEFALHLKCLSESKMENIVYSASEKLNVCFISDTDNRSNFPSEISFHRFKSQRDLFYEILKIWEENCMKNNWNFQTSLEKKIHLLLNMHSDSFNFFQLCRLFKDQLLSTCERRSSEKATDLNSTILTSLPIDKDKFNRLKNRLTTKQSSDGINYVPTFPGYQEFFKEFIVVSSNVKFSRHLCDIFITEILELNGTSFVKLEESSHDFAVDQETKTSYVKCVKSLRVLSKFLGFIETYPYKTDVNSIPDNVMETQKKIREQIAPAFDILSLLKAAISSNNLLLTIPWICIYLSMFDKISLKTEYYTKVIDLLVILYRTYDLNEMFKKNLYLIKFTIGWLFENENFPTNRFFKEIDPKLIEFVNKNNNMGIDKTRIIDQDIIYIFCPILNEIKKLLNNKSAPERNTVRHITPLSAISGKSDSIKKIENQLEEAFFNGHPASMKKTVDFVIERITSSCIKHICYTLVPEFKENLRKSIRTSAEKEPSKLTEHYFEKLRTECDNKCDKIIKENIPKAIDSLLPVDTLENVKSVCVSVCERMCYEKVNWWIKAHITLAVIKKEVDGELNKIGNGEPKRLKNKLSNVLPSGGLNKPHNKETLSAANALNEVQEHICSIINRCPLNENTVVLLLENVFRTLTERNDVNDYLKYVICSQLVELSLLLVTHNFNLMDKDDIKNKFIAIWNMHNEPQELFESILCPRNIMLVTQAGATAESAWIAFGKFCAYLIKENIISCDNFESQCTSLFRQDHDNVILRFLTSFIRSFVDYYKMYVKCGPNKFTFLLDWMGDYCIDL